MMKLLNLLKLSSLALMICATAHIQAADVNLATAQNAARSFLNKQVASGRLKAAAASSLQLVKAEASVAKPTAVDYYIFNSDKSYVVIAGDDQAPEILMYGEEGKLDMNNIPPAMQWLLNKYKYQIDGLKAGTMQPTKAPKTATTAVAPLVKANWDQSAPYNNQCPTSGSSRALTGCPATSLAMCYYKWKWPKTFPAVAAISSANGIAAPALPERVADWDNIIDEYTGPSNYTSTTAQKNAVAWLMRYAGQAIPDYSYGTSASGANDPEIYQGVLNMGYTNAQYLLLTELQGSYWGGYSNGPQQYTDAQWNEFMLNELYKGNPIEYLAYDYSSYSLSGHAFNVFGCDTNGKYYVNWGWSGDSNGYCTLHNFTTSTGATGQSGSYVFNYGEAMIISIAPPGPVLETSSTAINLTCNTGETATATFTVTGDQLTDKVTITKTDANNVFTVSPTSVTIAQAEAGQTVTVTFHPTAHGTFTGKLTLKSADAEDVIVNLNGVATLKKGNVTLQEATDVTETSFKAMWTDATPRANVASYTLEVKEYDPNAATLLIEENFNKFTAPNSTDIGTTLDSWMDNTGWTGSKLYREDGGIRLGTSSAKGTLTSPALDLSDSEGKVTVKFTAIRYNNDNNPELSISCGSSTQTLAMTDTDTEYTVVLDAPTQAGQKVEFATTKNGKRVIISHIEIHNGDVSEATMTLKAPAEQGDANYRLVTGITDLFYNITGLTPAKTYRFKVKPLYIDGTEGNWTKNKQVTLAGQAATLPGDVNNDGKVDVQDVNILVNILLGTDQASNYEGRADVDGNGKVDVGDINTVINTMLNSNN